MIAERVREAEATIFEVDDLVRIVDGMTTPAVWSLRHRGIITPIPTKGREVRFDRYQLARLAVYGLAQTFFGDKNNAPRLILDAAEADIRRLLTDPSHDGEIRGVLPACRFTMKLPERTLDELWSRMAETRP